MPKSQTQYHHFNKYDFVKAFIATTTDKSRIEEKEREAVIIADAIEERQNILLENLVTKQDLKRDLKELEHKLTIRLTAIMAALLTFLPLATEFLKRLL